MQAKTAHHILQQVKDNYNEIALDFNVTRQNIWPELLPLQKYLRPNLTLLDFGCGNGRLIKLFSAYNINYTGVDISPQQIVTAQNNFPQHKFLIIDGQALPWANNTFDQVWNIAAYHQIPSQALRIAVLQEIKRVLKPNGLLIITVWNLYRSKYFKSLWQNFYQKIFKQADWDWGDLLIPWRATPQKTINRYYHAFTPRELKREILLANFKILELAKLERQQKLVGWAIIGQKSTVDN